MGISTWMRRAALGGAATAAVFGLAACEPEGVDLVVTTDADGGDVQPGDGVCEMTAGTGDCSLRAAIDEANALPDHETITFAPGIELVTVFGEGDDTNETGDLDVTDGVTIDGGDDGVEIAGTEHDRVFDLHGGDPAPFTILRRVTIAGGNADDGGGVRLTGPQTTTIDRSAVLWNVGGSTGGGVHVGAGATLSVNNSTIGHNWSDGPGGALWSEGSVSVVYSTVADNFSPSGALHRDGGATGALTLLASVVGVQEDTDGCAGSVSSLGDNVAVDATCALAGAGDQQGVDPRLDVLADNGGPTETYLPFRDSPAVDAVDPASAGCGGAFALDGRGTPRPQHGDCDAGAVEVGYTPMGLGNGTNYLGTGNDPTNLLPTADHENLWLGISGPCASNEQGDLLAPLTDANWNLPPSGGFQCQNSGIEGATVPNPDHDPNGYFYGVTVTEAMAGQPLHIDGYDLSHCTSSAAGDTSTNLSIHSAFTTRYRLRGPDATPAESTDNPVVAPEVALVTGQSCTAPSGLTGGGHLSGWRRLFTVPAAEPGTYLVQVSSDVPPTMPNQLTQGRNHFSLRASAGEFAPCSTASPDCPVIEAMGWRSQTVSLAVPVVRYRLGALDQADAASLLELDLWDPGEGSLGFGLLAPGDVAVGFDWQVRDRSGADVEPLGGWSGSVAPGGRLDTSGTGPQPGPYRLSSSRYNDRMLRLATPLATVANSGVGRWSLRAETGTTPTDVHTLRAGVWEVGTAP